MLLNSMASSGIVTRHFAGKQSRINLWGKNHKRCKTKSSPMKKRALGSCNTIERDTIPLIKAAVGTRSLLMSCSDWASEMSDCMFGAVSINVPGEMWGAFSFSSRGEAG